MKKAFACIIILLLLSSCGNSESEKEMAFTGDVTITVQPVAFLDSYTKTAMDNYSVAHPNVKFEILEPIDWNTRDMGLSRVYTDITKGKGPDIVIAEREDLSSLVTKDCFLDISDSLSSNTQKALIKSIFGYGEYNEKNYLAPGNQNLSMLIVSDENVDGDSWTIEDLISLIENREKEGEPFEWIAITSGLPCRAASVFDLFTRCIDSSNFIDWENKTCHFDDPLFIKVLEISKRYDSYADSHTPDAKNMREEISLLKQGKVLAIYGQNPGFIEFSEEQNLLGPGYSYIGFPCDNGNGRRVVYATNMAVNKNTEYAGVIKDFIDFYYSLESCKSNGQEVRTDLYSERIKYDKDLDVYLIKNYRDQGDAVLSVKEDGSDYSEEYFGLLNTFSATDITRYNKTLEIEKILYEEADSFYAEDKTAEEVANLIQKRVSILLNE